MLNKLEMPKLNSNFKKMNIKKLNKVSNALWYKLLCHPSKHFQSTVLGSMNKDEKNKTNVLVGDSERWNQIKFMLISSHRF